jgi:hypothetical protein
MAQSVTLDVKGLWTYSSEVSGVPLGSQSVLLNCNINRSGIVEPRKGFNLLTYGLPLAADRPNKLVFWNSEIFAHYNSATFAYYNTGSGFSSRGSLAAPSNATSVRAVKSQNKNLYVTSSTGLKKTDAIATSLYSAGIPKGLDIGLAVAGAGSAVADGKSVGYRYILGRKDANSNFHRGGVSGLFTLSNAAGSTQNVTATCYLPTGLDTTYFLELYRSTAASSTDGITSSLQKCYELPITSTHISNGYATITDVVPDSLLEAYIPTSTAGGGSLAQDAAKPPLARDIVEWKDCMFYADVDSPQRLQVALTAVSGSGLAAADTITVVLGATTEVYTAHGTTFNSAIKQFVVSTGGSASQNIFDTVRSFIKCVNLASAVVNAYSLQEDVTKPPGKLFLEAKTISATTFTVTSSRAAAFAPNLPSPATIDNTSAADTYPNGLMYSKPAQPEAVPVLNMFKVGSSDDRIKRIVALRDGLFIFKERDGAFVVRGDNAAAFTVTPLDNTAKLVAPDSLATINNMIYGLFEAGICEVSDTGVSIISIPIKDQLLPLYGTPLTAVKAYSFGYGSDTDGKYVLAVPETSSDTYCTKQFVFDTFGRTFCTWDLDLTCGGVNPVDAKQYLGSGTSNYIKQERRVWDHTDFADFVATCTITSYSGTTVHINNTSGMTAGDIIYQGSNAIAYIESVDSANGTIVIDSEQAWTLSTADVTHVAAIDCQIQWNPDFGGNAAGLKQYYECAIIAQQAFQKSATVVFSSDINPAEESIPITSAAGNGEFGEFVFGDEVWGGDQAMAPKRVGIPRSMSRCNQLTVRFENRVAFSDFQITGISLSFNNTSTRTTR